MKCWVRACKYNEEGECSGPERPEKEGCALTWFFTGKTPEGDVSG